MLGDLMGKLQEAQALMQESKEKLEKIEIETTIENGAVRVKVNGNKKIVNIEISEEVLNNKERAEDLILTAINKALEKADKASKSEISGLTSGIIPGLSNLLG